MAEAFQGTLTERKQLSPDTSLFIIKLNKPLSFIPGQFGMLSLCDGSKEMKAFSLCSQPGQSTVEFCIKKYPDGKFSPRVFDAKIGSPVELKGPYGLFQLKEGTSDLIFIAGGTGIAPLRSMIAFLCHQKTKRKMWLFYRFKNQEDFLFKEELENCAKENKKFTLVTSVSNPSTTWKGETERVHTIIKKYVSTAENKEIYICGPPQMVDETISNLLTQGFTKEQIHREVW